MKRCLFPVFCAIALTALPGALPAADTGVRVTAFDPGAGFDAANRMYEQGHYGEAAAAYERLLQVSGPSPALYFNLGNAWFKAGQNGRAIAAWRMAENLTPRDPSVRFNLHFVRKKVAGTEEPARPAWQRALASLTLNEWSLLAAGALWLWFLLLSCREWRPTLRPALSGYTATAGLCVLFLAACVAGAASLRFQTVSAVVTVHEAIARSGPLEEAKVLHQFRDGVELTVLDVKEMNSDGQKQAWLQVRHGANQTGWVKSDQVTVLR